MEDTKTTMEFAREFLEEGRERRLRKVCFVAAYMAMVDGNAGVGQFAHLPQGTQEDYLHDAANAVEACERFDAEYPV